MCRATAVWEWYPLWYRPGHESEDEDQHKAGAACQRKHWAAGPRRWQHHIVVVCPVSSSKSKGATGGSSGDGWVRKRVADKQASQRAWGLSTFKGTHQPSAQRPSVQEQHVRVGARLRLAKAISPSRRRCTTEDPLLSSIKQLRWYLSPANGPNERRR